MPKTKKTAPAAPEEDSIESIFEHFKMTDKTPEAKAKGEADPANDQLAQLTENLKTLSTRFEQMQDNITSLAAGSRTAPAAPRAPEMPKVSLQGLPDPAEDRAAYETALSERLSGAISQGISAMTKYNSEIQERQRAEEQAGTTIYEDLWEDFKKRHKDLAEHADLVEVAATQVMRKAEKKGLNLKDYLTTNSSRFIDEVADVTRERFKTALGAGKEDSEENEENKDDSDRTGGIFGGETQAVSAPKPEGKGGSLTSDLMEVQRGLGIF